LPASNCRSVDWTPGLDPKTGKPLNYSPNADVQIYTERSHGTRASRRAKSWRRSVCRARGGGRYRVGTTCRDFIDCSPIIGDQQEIVCTVKARSAGQSSRMRTTQA
jgi:hypothetical protein